MLQPAMQSQLLPAWFSRAVIGLVAVYIAVMIGSLLSLIPWNTLPNPQSSWQALTQVEIASSTALLCGAIAILFLIFLLSIFLLGSGPVRQLLGDAPLIFLCRLASFFGTLGVVTAVAILGNRSRTLGAAPPADQLVTPFSGPQLGVAFFLHPADEDGIVLTFFTVGTFGLFGLLAMYVAHRHLQTSPRWIRLLSHFFATLSALGIAVALDRLFPLDPRLPLSETGYRWAIWLALTAVPAAYVLMSIEIGVVQWRSVARAWRGGRRPWAILMTIILGFWVAAVSFPVMGGLYLAYFYTPPANSLIWDEDGQLIDVRNPGYSTLRMPAEEIPWPLMQAVESIEDPGLLRSPMTHSPLNPVTLIGSGVRLLGEGPATGGSGLAAQVCKVVSEMPLSRGAIDVPRWWFMILRASEKVFEVPCAWTLEKLGGPERTIELWLNTVNYACLGDYGASEVRGVAAASRVYFNKSLAELTVPEMALLARVPQSPCGIFAWGNTAYLLGGRNQVLRAMSERQGYLTPEDTASLMAMPLGLPERPSMPPAGADAFIEQVMVELQGQGWTGFSVNGSSIITTLDLGYQQALEQACVNAVAQQTTGELAPNDCGAVLLHRSPDDPMRFEVVAYVGNLTSVSGPAARPDLVMEQTVLPGSTIKGLLYACALSAGVLAPDEYLDDTGWEMFPGEEEPVVNWDLKAWGPQPASQMLSGSRNVPAAELVARLTPEGFVQCLEKTFGIDTALDLGLNVRLGLGLSSMPLYDLAVGYTPFITDGYLVDPVMVAEVTSRDGKLQRLDDPAKPQEVLGCVESRWVSDALLQVGAEQGLPVGVAVKTGTTDASSVAVAYSGNWILATWLGKIEPKQPLQQVEAVPWALTIVQEFSWWYATTIGTPLPPTCSGSTSGFIGDPLAKAAVVEQFQTGLSRYIDIGYAGDEHLAREGFMTPEDVSFLGRGWASSRSPTGTASSFQTTIRTLSRS